MGIVSVLTVVLPPVVSSGRGIAASMAPDNSRWNSAMEEGRWHGFSANARSSASLKGGIWHLWGHSWEIDQLGLWDEFAQMLDYVCRRQDVLYVNNSDLPQYVTRRPN